MVLSVRFRACCSYDFKDDGSILDRTFEVAARRDGARVLVPDDISLPGTALVGYIATKFGDWRSYVEADVAMGSAVEIVHLELMTDKGASIFHSVHMFQDFDWDELEANMMSYVEQFLSMGAV